MYSTRFVTVAAVLAPVVLSACSPMSSSATSATSAPTAASTAPSAAASPGPLGVLPVPAGAKAWKDNSDQPMSLQQFVTSFYIASARTTEVSLYRRRGFQSGIFRGWINADGSQQSIAVIRFAGSTGAISLYDGVTSTMHDKSKPVTSFTDAAVHGAGIIDPSLDSLGNTLVEIIARQGNEVIDIHQYDAATPDRQAGEALILQQYRSLSAK